MVKSNASLEKSFCARSNVNNVEVKGVPWQGHLVLVFYTRIFVLSPFLALLLLSRATHAVSPLRGTSCRRGNFTSAS